MTDSFASHWFFHIPNLALAAAMYTLMGRYVLELLFSIFAKGRDAVILRVFRQVTDPILRIVRVITPGIVPDGLVIVFAFVWLLAFRLFLYLSIVAAGVAPFLSPAG